MYEALTVKYAYPQIQAQRFSSHSKCFFSLPTFDSGKNEKTRTLRNIFSYNLNNECINYSYKNSKNLPSTLITYKITNRASVYQLVLQ